MVLSTKLRSARQEAELTQQRAAELAGLERNSIWRYEAGRQNPSAQVLFNLASLYGKTVEWFFDREEHQPLHPQPTTEESAHPPPTGTQSTNDPLNQIQAGIARLEAFLRTQAHSHGVAGSLEEYDPSNYDPSDRSPVELFEVRSAAGVGAEVYDETPVGLLWFRNDWLQSHFIDPRQSHIIAVRGESMEPTLPDGCSILVDRKRREPQEDRIFVMRTEEGLVVKRLGLDERGRWELLSDNPDWDPVLMSYGAEIIGEVRWVARTF